ncbi:hypothetical protein [Nocardia farcinica]|uniref:hypothetical protein n=1 Tax=Nocardia farcinica TaxID=37329 RepID=UPI001893F282|nr:hypothetical protein [Nocardia farcinica]MBF6411182.1 hypothetical protein [Nocardia farcinica]
MAQYNVDDLVSELIALGVTEDTIAALSRVERFGGEWIAWGRAGETQLHDLIAATRERKALLDRIEFLAVAIGEDGPARRAGADAKNPTLAGLRAVIAGVEKYARAHRIDIRTDAEKNAPATEAQIDYIVALLEGRARRGEGGGFMSTRGLYKDDGTVDRAAVAAMTRRTASAMIDSLRGTY